MTTVLVVHGLNRRHRRVTVEWVRAFAAYAPPGVEVRLHNVRRPTDGLPDHVDAVFLTYELLHGRSSNQWPWMMDRLDDLAGRGDTVVAFPQDDYTFNRVLDQSLEALGVDVIYSPIEDDLDVVYPRMHTRAEIRLALTGYVDEQTAARWAPIAEAPSKRRTDVGQRVAMTPAWYGRGGRAKGEFAERFAKAAAGSRLLVDISTDPSDAIPGEGWYRFLLGCRATLGTKGGASLCDPDGSIARCVREFVSERPHATFEQIERACFPGLDGHANMRAISPRLFDAAMLGTAQILVDDDYLDGALQPWEHFIPTDPEVSNFDDIETALADGGLVDRISAAASDALVGSGEFTYRRFVQGVYRSIVPSRAPSPSTATEASALDQIQWRLSPPLFEALQRCAELAQDGEACGRLHDLAATVDEVLTAEPILAEVLDPTVLEYVRGSVGVSATLDAHGAELIDVLVECWRAGALRHVARWLREVGTGSVDRLALQGWIDWERMTIDEGAATGFRPAESHPTPVFVLPSWEETPEQLRSLIAEVLDVGGIVIQRRGASPPPWIPGAWHEARIDWPLELQPGANWLHEANPVLVVTDPTAEPAAVTRRFPVVWATQDDGTTFPAESAALASRAAIVVGPETLRARFDVGDRYVGAPAALDAADLLDIVESARPHPFDLSLHETLASELFRRREAAIRSSGSIQSPLVRDRIQRRLGLDVGPIDAEPPAATEQSPIGQLAWLVASGTDPLQAVCSVPDALAAHGLLGDLATGALLGAIATHGCSPAVEALGREAVTAALERSIAVELATPDAVAALGAAGFAPFLVRVAAAGHSFSAMAARLELLAAGISDDGDRETLDRIIDMVDSSAPFPRLWLRGLELWEKMNAEPWDAAWSGAVPEPEAPTSDEGSTGILVADIERLGVDALRSAEFDRAIVAFDRVRRMCLDRVPPIMTTERAARYNIAWARFRRGDARDVWMPYLGSVLREVGPAPGLVRLRNRATARLALVTDAAAGGDTAGHVAPSVPEVGVPEPRPATGPDPDVGRRRRRLRFRRP